ncbi:MAG: hypothetical protein GY705_17640 [Bacteroidetes bacterium]|nr:hypothetical protein [Bacteroidota bacterium]
MKNVTFLLVCSLLMTTTMFGQRDETLFGDSGLRLTGAWGSSVVGLTKFENENAVVRGGYGGLEFSKSVLIGWGGYESDNAIELENEDRFDLKYNGLMIGVTPKSHKAIHPNVMLLIGGGKVNLRGEGRDNVFAIQPSAGLEINVFRWFRFGVQGGYRFITNTDLTGISDSDLSAPFGELQFKFGWSWGH